MKSLKRVLAFLRPHWLFAALGPVMMLLEVVMDLLQPRFMQKIVDEGIQNGDMPLILQTGLLMLLVALIGLAGGIGCSLFSTTAGVRMGSDIRSSLYRKIQSLSSHEMDTLTAGSLVTRMTNDIIQIQDIVVMMLKILVRAPLQVIGSLVMAVLISPRLSLVLVVIVPLLFLAIAVIMKYSLPLFSLVQDKLDGINVVTRENLSGIRVVKAFVREEHETRRFNDANNDYIATMEKAAGLIAIIHPVMILLMNGGIILVLFFGGSLSVSGSLTTGELIAFINYIMQLLMALMMVSMLLIRFSRGEASASRIMEVFDTVPAMSDSPDPVEWAKGSGEIQFDHVSFSYSGESEENSVLCDISFSLRQGLTTGIIGTTGSGKSTLVNLMPRLYDVSSGRILLDGTDIRELARSDVRSAVCIVPQQAQLFSGTIRDNIAWGYPEADDEAILKAADTAQILDFIEQSEKGLDTELNQNALNLSGGQKQRLSIARALLPDPPVLVLDDSTSALDAGTARILQEKLKEERSRKATMIIGQRISSVMNADTIIVLDDGRIVDNAPHSVLLERCGLYREIVESQMGKEAVDG